MLPVVVDGVDLRRVHEPRGVLVAHDGVVLPAVPQPQRDVEELVGAAVAVRGIRMVGEAEVGRGALVGGGHHVPAGPALAHVVEGGEAAGQAVRVVVGGRGGRDEPDLAGGRRQRGHQGDRVERVERAELGLALEDRVVGEEDRVEFPAFGDAGEFDVVVDVGDGRHPGLGQPPRGLVLTDVAQERIQMKLSRGRCHQTGAPLIDGAGSFDWTPGTAPGEQFRSAKFQVDVFSSVTSGRFRAGDSARNAPRSIRPCGVPGR